MQLEETVEVLVEENDCFGQKETGSEKDPQSEQEEEPLEEEPKNISHDTTCGDEIRIQLPSQPPRKLRMCAMCTKEPALTGKGGIEDEEDEDTSLITGIGTMKLRERRTIERQITNEQRRLRSRRKAVDDEEDEGEFENDFDLDDYDDEGEEEPEELGIPVRDAGLV